MKFGFIVLIFGSFCLPVIAQDETVQITLAPNVLLNRLDVTLGDVAQVRGGDSVQLRRIRSIDLQRLDDEKSCILSAEFIRLRLILANYTEDKLQFRGADQVIVQLDERTASIEQILQQAIEQAVSDRVEYPISSVQVRILQPIQRHWGINASQLVTLTPKIILPEGSILGRQSIVVHIYDREHLYATRSVPCEIAILQDELRLTRHVARGEVISVENTVLKERFLTSSAGHLTLKNALGRRVRRPMEVGERLSSHDLLPENENTNSDLVIKSRSAIRLIAKMGRLEITVPMAEALQSGRVGQIIRVKNLQSNRIVNARVVNAEEAVVDLGFRK
ncbi:flagellar basal body P-ring formation chaperone FlgA [Thalassoglobus polymorphus]|nr:flagellar basal body P-ring formation chaperone FlgA [Thalassoglobus polymorphus]